MYTLYDTLRPDSQQFMMYATKTTNRPSSSIGLHVTVDWVRPLTRADVNSAHAARSHTVLEKLVTVTWLHCQVLCKQVIALAILVTVTTEESQKETILDSRDMIWLVAWRSCNVLCRINEVALRRARLVLGWVTVYGQVNHLGPKPPVRSAQPSTLRGMVK